MPAPTELSSTRIPIVGIDLGTTHSLIAVVERSQKNMSSGRPRVLPSREGQFLLPSIVSFLEGVPHIGFAAKQAKVTHAQQTIFSVKRLLGKTYSDFLAENTRLPFAVLPDEGLLRIPIGDRSYSGIEISAMILKELKESAEEALGYSLKQAVITVPAYFNDAQRQATRTAGRLAGWDVLRILNEPTAAALAYGLDQKQSGLIAVFDLGGGTFDVSILKLQKGIFEVLATHGDPALGGDDLDQIFVQAAVQAIQAEDGFDIFAHPSLHAALLDQAEKAKIQLSQAPHAVVEVPLPHRLYRQVWSLEEFEKEARKLLYKTIQPCHQALQDAGLQPEDLSDVVMVGGPTRLNIVQEIAAEIFKRKPNLSMHPDQVVVEGAAIQGDILAGNRPEFLLLDVVPLSLGLETYGELMEPFIPRNTRIPTVARQVFTTFVNQQTGVDIHVLQGEREKSYENRSLARFKLTGLHPMPAGMPRIEVTFLVDADGILQVSASDLRTNHTQAIEVRPTYGLTEEQITVMLQKGLEATQEDQAYRALVEARQHASPILQATEKTLPWAIQHLPVHEVNVIQEALGELRQVFSEQNAQAIQRAASRLDQSTRRLAELYMQSEPGQNPPRLPS